MNAKVLQVDVEDLEIGMYVSKLDRPWLDTPFLFQGFHIVEDGDVDELRRHCRHVFIDIEQTDPAVDIAPLLRSQRKPKSATEDGMSLPSYASAHTLRKKNPTAGARTKKRDETASESPTYSDVGEIRRELSNAREEHDKASDLVKEIMNDLSAGNTLDLKSAQQAVRPIVHSVMKNQSAMALLVRMRQAGDYMYRHSVSSAIWATVLARHIGLPKETIETASLGAMLLDIGKTRVPQEILAKPGPLTDSETAIVRSHVQLGLDILEESGDADPLIVTMLRTHHERHDGSGYPQGIEGQQIPVLGRIAGIVDYYDAVTSTRPYADAVSTYDCLRSLNKVAGTLFQAEMVEQFIQSIGFFPPGTLVQLNDNSVAVVVAQNRRHRLKPEIILVLDPDHNMCRDFQMIDLQMQVRSCYTDKELYIDKGLEPGSFGIDPSEFFL